VQHDYLLSSSSEMQTRIRKRGRNGTSLVTWLSMVLPTHALTDIANCTRTTQWHWFWKYHLENRLVTSTPSMTLGLVAMLICMVGK